jgi:hypothetical protein
MAKRLRILSGILAVFCTTPIWFYLLHWMLERSGAGDLQWFLFWVYVPVLLFVAILKTVFDGGTTDGRR